MRIAAAAIWTLVTLPALGQAKLELTTVGDSPTGFRRVFSKQVKVFGVPVFATRNTPDTKVLHAASVMAQYLDNDADGQPDNPLVVKALIKGNGTLVMFATERAAERVDIHRHIPEEVWDDMLLVALYGEETHPDGSTEGHFDVTLEEVLHLITSAGYANAYPAVFGEKPGTQIAKAMDLARGRHFRTVPRSYPSGAWYTYDDETCDYGCQITEYIYWGLTSFLGAQDFPGRYREISHEWRLNTKEKVMKGDPMLYQLLVDPKYALPKILPDGNYRPLLRASK